VGLIDTRLIDTSLLYDGELNDILWGLSPKPTPGGAFDHSYSRQHKRPKRNKIDDNNPKIQFVGIYKILEF